MKPIPKTARILMEARKLIDTEEKWTQDKHEIGAGQRFCILSAIGKAANYDAPTGRDAVSAVKASLPHPFRWPHYFNDAPSTTHADVMAVFDKAIQAEMEKG